MRSRGEVQQAHILPLAIEGGSAHRQQRGEAISEDAAGGLAPRERREHAVDDVRQPHDAELIDQRAEPHGPRDVRHERAASGRPETELMAVRVAQTPDERIEYLVRRRASVRRRAKCAAVVLEEN